MVLPFLLLQEYQYVEMNSLFYRHGSGLFCTYTHTFISENLLRARLSENENYYASVTAVVVVVCRRTVDDSSAPLLIGTSRLL